MHSIVIADPETGGPVRYVTEAFAEAFTEAMLGFSKRESDAIQKLLDKPH
ncbi:MAG: hypothetical protein MK142_09005 [Pseudomonadales bacterium]|nr:hypothetical protein [Pseudomonadales bacterium]